MIFFQYAIAYLPFIPAGGFGAVDSGRIFGEGFLLGNYQPVGEFERWRLVVRKTKQNSRFAFKHFAIDADGFELARLKKLLGSQIAFVGVTKRLAEFVDAKLRRQNAIYQFATNAAPSIVRIHGDAIKPNQIADVVADLAKRREADELVVDLGNDPVCAAPNLFSQPFETSVFDGNTTIDIRFAKRSDFNCWLAHVSPETST